MSTKHLFNLNTDLPWKLRDLKMLRVTKTDGKSFETPQTLGYYREPMPDEYPIELNKGNPKLIKPVPIDFEELKCLKYLMSQRNAGEFDFCTNRGTIVRIGASFNFSLVATKFRNCIYMKHINYEESTHRRERFQKKLRQFVIVDTPGDIPDTKKPVDHSKRFYGTFSAKLGKFRLLYTADIIGVENSEPIGDLNDTDALQKCKLTLIKLYPIHCTDWVTNYRTKRWILQAHFAGIEHIKLAGYTNKGKVPLAITNERCDNLIKEQEWSLSDQMSLLHLYLSEIREVMTDVDCPYTTYVFELKDMSVSYKCIEGKNKDSFLSQEYIDFVLGL